jgi:HAE1 family hydrophobic/amphiphilic exporter-1
LNVSDISESVELLFSGNKTVKYRDGGDEYDIDVRLREDDRATVTDLEQVYIITPSEKA